MSQVSYGTITITDTNDIESIVIEYNKNQSNQNPPSEGDSNWSTSRPTWQQGYYIWQRARIHKSGTATTADIIGTPVCVTGSTGEQGQPGTAGRSLTGVETKYCIYGTGTPSDSYSGWQDTIPEYNSSTPNYWVKVTNTYSSAPTTEVVKYKDTGITNAMAKAADAQSRAATAETNAASALSLSQATQQHFWFNSVKTGNIEAGAYITDVVIDSFKPNKSGNYLLAGSNGIELGNGSHPYMQLTASELNFFHPNNNTIDAQLSSNGLIVKSGGIEAGTVGQNGGIYLSTKDYGTAHNNQTITINSHEATNWRQIIGTKFGVDSDGVLYAGGANIQGKITVTSGSNVYTTDDVNPLEVGGRNLFGYGSDLQTSLDGLNNHDNGFSIVTEDGVKCAHTSGALKTTKYLQSKLGYTPRPSETFTYSGFVKLKNIVRGTTNPMCEFYFSGQTINGSWKAANVYKAYVDGEYKGTSLAFDRNITDTEWHHFAVVGTYDNANFTGNFQPNIYLRDCTGDLYIHHVKVERGNKATDWTPAPEDIEAAAVAEEQYIYISKASGTTSVSSTTTWITEAGDKQNTWTTKRPTYNASYPVLFVAKQKKVIDGTVTCTTPVKDDTTTIIDGGHITTGTIDASKANITNISASMFTSSEQEKILNSKIEIGGRNLLIGTAKSVSKVTTSTSSYVTQALYDTPSQATLSELGFSANDEVTLSFDWKVTSAITYGNARIEWYGEKDSTSMTYIAPLINPFATFSASNISGHVVTTVKLTSATILSKRIVLRIDNSNLTLTISNLKLEKGNKATDWTPAPEDVQSNAENYADIAAAQAKAELDLTKIDAVSESTSLLDNINAISDQITLLASRINFGNVTVADNLTQLNTAVSIDTATSTVQIGDANGFHIKITGNELGFFNSGGVRIAYLNGQQLYITKSVVLQQMDLGTSYGYVDPVTGITGLGQWSWKVHPNGETPSRNNLNLKWVG